jgi:hypothetical protein
MSDFVEHEYGSDFTFNRIHKRFMVLYDADDMRKVWKKVRSEWKKYKGEKLPKRFKKYPEIWIELNHWIEDKISKFVADGGEDVHYLNKSDLKLKGWDDKILLLLYPKPDKNLYLGRGRHAYYYNGTHVGELEDCEEFIEHITLKLERKRKRELAKLSKSKKNTGFGSEFILG